MHCFDCAGIAHIAGIAADCRTWNSSQNFGFRFLEDFGTAGHHRDVCI